MSVPQLYAAITPFLSRFTGVRVPVAYDDDNRPVYGTPVSFVTIGSLQESTEKDLQLVPEGEYTEEYFTYFTRDILLSGNDDSVLKPDEIIFNGQNYKVVGKAQWQLHGYYRYLVRKLDAGAE